MRVIIQCMFKRASNILRNNMIFIQPLLLYLLLLMTSLTFVLAKEMYFVSKCMLLLSIILMTIAFSAGWFYVNRLGVQNYNSSDEVEVVVLKAKENIKKFFVGVGENFFKSFGGFVICTILYFVGVFVVGNLCLSVYGEPTVIMDMPKLAQIQTNAELVAYLNNISETDKLAFVSWIWAFVVLSSVLNFFCILYFAVLNIEKRNIFATLWLTVKFFFMNLIPNIGIIFSMFFAYLFLNILSFLLGAGPISFFILIILFALYLNYYVLLVFCFYDEKTKDNSNNRSE